MEWILENKEWLFSGLGIVVITLGVEFLNRKKKKENTLNVSNTSTNNNSNIINVNIDESISKNKTMKPNVIKDKSDIQILFIDDEKFDIVTILKDAGWKNTKTIKDVKNLDCIEVKNADVIFVDINGVGCKLFPNDQGLGLAEAIKTRNQEKCVIIYSAQEQRLHKAFSIVDSVLPKNADPYEFTTILDNYLRKRI